MWDSIQLFDRVDFNELLSDCTFIFVYIEWIEKIVYTFCVSVWWPLRFTPRVGGTSTNGWTFQFLMSGTYGHGHERRQMWAITTRLARAGYDLGYSVITAEPTDFMANDVTGDGDQLQSTDRGGIESGPFRRLSTVTKLSRLFLETGSCCRFKSKALFIIEN